MKHKIYIEPSGNSLILRLDDLAGVNVDDCVSMHEALGKLLTERLKELNIEIVMGCNPAQVEVEVKSDQY